MLILVLLGIINTSRTGTFDSRLNLNQAGLAHWDNSCLPIKDH